MMRRVFLFFVAVLTGSLVLNCAAPRSALMAVKEKDPVLTDRPHYRIEASWNPGKDELTGQMAVRLPEKRKEPLNEIWFNLYPNAFRNWKYGNESRPEKPGWIDISHVRVDGKKVRHEIRETAMKVPLPAPLTNGRSALVEMDFRLKLPRGGSRLNRFKRTAFLAQWYPMLAVKDDGGWHTDPYTATGDPFYTQMSDFEVTFKLPAGYRVISSGKDHRGPTRQTVTIRQDNIRDFAAVLTADYKSVSGNAGGIRVNVWYLPGMESVREPLLRAAVNGMNFFSEKFGAYPYDEVDVVLGETGFGIAGMEYPGLVTSVPTIPTRKGQGPAVNVVVHELAHQWWYGVVGNDQVKEPWLDEGLTTFSEFLYMKEKENEDETGFLERASRKADEVHQTLGVTAADRLYDYPDSVYGLMVYLRPAAMMFRLMDEIGEEKVLKIMSTYYDRYRFKTATTRDFIRVAGEVAGKDLVPFFREWLLFGKKREADAETAGF
ncbi:M1 family metallopeptidase [Staphylospora marina]|uniref:M1 family metallopeptidase n=1 Tax=Staphylospora marina TaxID=2490858 RepID=UPI000F5BDC34|nr:M1 family metallopeptidase [Staphylospora marina]